jgi:uncharacterized protein (TIGR02246 family)
VPSSLSLADATALFDQRRRAWLDEDIDAYLALWSEDMTFRSPVHAEPLRGRDAFAALVRASAARTRPVRFDFHHLAVVGDAVLAEWTITVARRDDGREVTWDGMSVCGLRAGRIAWWREYWNPMDLSGLA